jgi:hypothetical protein
MPDLTLIHRAADLHQRVRTMLDWMPPNGPTRALQDSLRQEAQLAAGRRDVDKLERLVQQMRLLEKMLWDHRHDRLKAVEAPPPPPHQLNPREANAASPSTTSPSIRRCGRARRNPGPMRPRCGNVSTRR